MEFNKELLLRLLVLERWRRFSKAVKEISKYSFEHFLFLGGLATMAYGCWLVWHPLGFIVGGWFSLRISLIISAEHK